VNGYAGLMSLLIASFAVYTLIVIGIGLIAGRSTKADSEDYFLGGRSLGPVLSSLSSGASGSSAWVAMGLVGLAFASGLRAYWLIPGVFIGIGFNWFCLAAPMQRTAQETGAVTIPDLLSMRFGERFPLIRVLSVLVILSAMFLYVAAQMAAAGQMFAQVFPGLEYRFGVVIGVGIVLAYTVFGGFRAACWTDLFQSLMMLVALVAMPLVILFSGAAGDAPIASLEAADGTLVEAFPEAQGLALIGFVLGSGALGINLGYPGQPHVLVRLMALREKRMIPLAATLQLSWTVLIYAGAITTGLLVRAAQASGSEWAAGIDTETQELSMIIAAEALLPAVLSAFVLAAMVSAMASTADSQLIVAASAVSADGYERIVAPEESGGKLSRWLNRAAVLGLGIGAGVLVIDQRVSIYEYVLTYGWAILGAGFGPQVALAMLWKRATAAGCVAGMVTGVGVAIVWKRLLDTGALEAPWSSFYNLTVAFVCALVVNAAVSLVTYKKA